MQVRPAAHASAAPQVWPMPGAAPLLVDGSSDGSVGGDFPGAPDGFPGRPGFRGDGAPACVPGDVAPDGAGPGAGAAAPGAAPAGSDGAAAWGVGGGTLV